MSYIKDGDVKRCRRMAKTYREQLERLLNYSKEANVGSLLSVASEVEREATEWEHLANRLEKLKDGHNRL